MTKRRRMTAEFKRRSIAAKKGWETRRQRQLPKKIRATEKLLNNAAKAQGVEPNPRIETRRKSAKELEQDIVKLRIDLANATAELQTRGWVDSRAPEYLHADRSIAVHPCRLRHLEEAGGLRKAMAKARKKGEQHLNRMAHDIAEFYDLPVKEVFTLFYSP